MNSLSCFISFDLFNYWYILTQYIHPAIVVFWAIVGGFLGLVITIVAEFLLREKILVRRRHWSLKYLSYCYFVFFPLYASICFTLWFGYNSCERESVKNISIYIDGTNDLYYEYAYDAVANIVKDRYMHLTTKEAVNKALQSSEAIVLLAEQLGMDPNDLKNKAAAYRAENISDTGSAQQEMKAYLEDRLGTLFILDKNLTQELLNVKIQDVLNDDVLNKVIEQYFHKSFGGLKRNVILLLFLGFLLPVTEIVIANRLEKKRLTSPPPAPPHFVD